VGRMLRPGPGSMAGLRWLARCGPSPLDPWRYAMGWSEVAARSHARRLEREGWLERCPMTWGEGSLFLATRKGVLMLGVPLIAASTPAPTWWAHDSACAWAAAWLTVRGRRFLGQREVLSRPEWSGQLHWQDRNSFKRSGHRPDLVALRDSSRFAIEVELAGKSRPRLDAILKLYDDWIRGGQIGGVIYICGNEEGQRRVQRSAQRVAPFGRKLRLELLDPIKEQTVAAREASRSGRASGGSAAPAPMLGGRGG
jgi:hypothetical protein